jgi:hypothetical protein
VKISLDQGLCQSATSIQHNFHHSQRGPGTAANLLQSQAIGSIPCCLSAEYQEGNVGELENRASHKSWKLQQF